MSEWKYCHPNDGRGKRWIIMFDDTDRSNASIFYDELEARIAFDKASMNWNCHLFESSERKPLTISGDNQYFLP